VNRTSIGVECCWPGTWAQARKLGVDGHKLFARQNGDTVELLRPSEPLIQAWVRLAEALHEHQPVPRIVAPSDRRLTPRERRRHRGALEHFHVPGTTKRDGGGLLVGALRANGWAQMAA
jgi:hypothetical protein